MSQKRENLLFSTSIALFIPLTFLSGQYLVSTHSTFPIFGFLYPAVFLVAWFSGFRPAVVAATICALGADYVLVPPRFVWTTPQSDDLVRLAVFWLSSVFIAWIASRTRSAETTLHRAQERMQTILHSIGDAVIVVDEDGVVQFMNPMAERLTGWASSEALGHSAHEVVQVIDAATRRPLPRLAQRALQERPTGPEGSTLLIARDGSEHPIEDKVTPIRSERGNKTLGAVTVIRDISEQDRSRARLEESQALFRKLADDAPAMIWKSDVARNFTWLNRGWLEFTGSTMQENLGRGWLQFLHPEDTPRVESAFRESFEAKVPFALEFRVRRYDQQCRWVVNRSNPRFSLQGEFLGFIGSCLDIHEHHETSLALRESNLRYLLLSRATRDTVWDWDLTTDEVLWNESLADVMGFAPGYRHNTAQWWYDHLHPDDRDRVVDNIHDFIKHGEGHWSAEYRFRKADETYAKIYDRGFLVYDHEGNAVRMLGAMQDITQREAAAAALRELQVRFERLTSATNMGVFYCDLPFGDLDWNGAIREHFWMPSDQQPVHISTFYDRLHPEDRSRTREAIAACIEHKVPYDIEYRTVNPADIEQYKWIRAIGWTDYDREGVPIHFDGFTLDTTEFRRTSRQRDVALEQAREALRTRDEFLSVASHELKTPLTSLHLQIQLLARAVRQGVQNAKTDSPQTARYQALLDPRRLAARIASSAEQTSRLALLVDELLDLTRVRLGRLQLEKENLSLPEVTQDVLVRFKDEIEQKGYAIRLISENTSGLGFWDRSRVEQVVTNLVSNAIKYGRSRPIEIRVGSDPNGESAMLRVADQGIGISPEIQSKIFERFERGVSGQEISGLGLGLYIARQIVEAHGGTIGVESELGQGSAFIVRLPLSHSGDSVRLAGPDEHRTNQQRVEVTP